MALVDLAVQYFSREQVLRHNTRSDCWIIVRNSVYNITPFIDSHPGGMDILLTRAGEDATSYFMTKHGKNAGVMRHLERFKIGEIREGERISANDFSEPFLMELIDSCYKEKLYKQPEWKENPFFWTRLISVILFFGLSISALYSNAPWWISILLVAGQAIISTSLFGLIAHEAIHRNYPKNSVLKVLLRLTWPVFWPFISQNPLRYEHNSHHIKIGDPEFDYEVAAFAPLVRYSGHVKHRTIHKYQHLMARYLYPFYANIITTGGGIYSGFWKRHNRLVKFEHLFSVVATLSYFIVLPTLINGSPWWYITLYMVYQCILFYGIYVGAAINHFVPQVTASIPEERENQYGYYNCHHTTNFCSNSKFWFWYTGGFNIQIEHHLVPFIPVENLPRLIPIVKGLCAKYGYPYHDYPSFKELWNDHYDYLRTLSVDPGQPVIATEMANKTSYQGR